MLICPNCGEENPGRAKFCLACATPLGRAAAEERKVVTVLFCDLVGFTERSDKADPEDVKARLRPFHARIKREIEAFGGTLDKFIGDAALGVFGAPVAHEDDPERAVLAALAIGAAIEELNQADPSLGLAVRMGLETGEAVVAFGAGPQIGEAVTGDVVNTASRLQGVAPVGGIVVGERAFDATRDAFAYEPLPPVMVKGKAQPLRIWRAIEARGTTGADVIPTPFVGRQTEWGHLVGAYERAADDPSVQPVLVVGQPGVGKSRLVAELRRHLEGSAATWLSGRCPPYGEGITFWALAEIIRAHAGILETDTPEEAADKLDAAIPQDEVDRLWLGERIAPLVGARTAAAPAADREESFTAWRRFLESIAARGPTVVVFEDVHWADPALLAFVEHLAAHVEGAPMLVVCTARPEIDERDPGWADRLLGLTRIDLSPLSGEETADLVAAILQDAGPEIRALVLERAGGNPLFALEFVRLLRDRGLLAPTGGTLSTDAAIALPDSIQALIAARLDTVGAERKALLQDAAVVGKGFWAGAVAGMGERDPGTVSAMLDELSRKELVIRVPSSSIDGEDEYAFSHALIREVAYGQIPRASRAARHRGAAAWLERVAAGRERDHAELLAHHYTMAVELSRAAGRDLDAQELTAPAVRFLELAGDHALGLDVGRSEAQYARALALLASDAPERPSILAKWAEAARQAGRATEAAAALDECIRGFLDRGERLAAGRAMGTLSSVLLTLGSARQAEVAAEAIRLLEPEPAGPDLVAAYARMAGVRLVQGDERETIAWADRAAALAAEIDVEAPARALGFRGFARSSLGDRAGLEDMRAALARMLERGESRDAAVLHNNLAVALSPIEGPAAVLSAVRTGMEFAERRGIEEFSLGMAAAALDPLVELGEWDAALEEAGRLAARADAMGDVAALLQARWAAGRILTGRGLFREAEPLVEWLVEAARGSGGPEDVTPGFTVGAASSLGLGRPDRARQLLSELDRWPHVRSSPAYPAYLGEMVRTAISAGDVDLAGRLADGVEPLFAYRQHALAAAAASLAEAGGDHAGAAERYGEAADGWRAFGVVPELAHALLGRGRCLVAVGSQDASDPLGEARDAFARLGAGPLVGEADELLARTSGDRSGRPH